MDPSWAAYVAAPFASFWGTYLILSLVSLKLDVEQPEWYRARSVTSVRPVVTEPMLRLVWINLAKNAIASLVVATIFWHQFFAPLGKDDTGPTSWLVWLFKHAVSLLLADVWFYHSHRLFHVVPWLYRLHLQHHAFTQPIALVAVYCHPVEMVCVNLITVLIGPTVTRMSPPMLVVWLMLACVYTLSAHCGHDWGSLLNPRMQDAHHAQFRVNFGLSPFWDTLYGTLSSPPPTVVGVK